MEQEKRGRDAFILKVERALRRLRVKEYKALREGPARVLRDAE